MQFAKPVVLGFSLLALAAASAYANDSYKQKSGSTQQPSMSQSNTPSSASSSDRSAAAGGSTSSAKSGGDQFDKLDKNHDGNISREEWNAGQRSGASGSSSPSTGSSTGSSSGSSTGSSTAGAGSQSGSGSMDKSKTDTSKPMGGGTSK